MAQDGAKIFVVGGKADDPFWAIVKKGVDDAALVVESHGGSATYLQPQTYDNLGPDAANLVRTAMSQGADGDRGAGLGARGAGRGDQGRRRRRHSGDRLQRRRLREGRRSSAR